MSEHRWNTLQCTCGHELDPGHDLTDRIDAYAAHIRTEVAEQIAQAIEAEMHNLARVMPGAKNYVTAHDDALTTAARIARKHGQP